MATDPIFAEFVAKLASRLESPSLVTDIDSVILRRLELRKLSEGLHGTSTPSTTPAFVAEPVPAAKPAEAKAQNCDRKPFDGTMGGLIGCYRTDPDSPYQGLRHTTRESYNYLCTVIERDHGGERLADLTGRTLKSWHVEWSKGETKIAIAHSLMTQTRALLGFGASILEDAECKRLSAALGEMRFKLPKSRSERLTPDDVTAIRSKA